MDPSAEPLLRRPYVTIFESELRVMAGLSAAWGSLETGGMAFGLLSRGGRPVIHLVTGPGPQAVHQYAHFQQDLEFARATVRTIEETYGSQYNGDWHSHHVLGLNETSSGDVNQVRSVSGHNSFARWCGFITTAADPVGDSAAGPGFGWNQAAPSAGVPPRVRVNAWVYTDPQASSKVRAPLRVLAGISPLRLALLANAAVAPARLGQYASSFPTDRIVYDHFEPEESLSRPVERIPKAIVAQLEKLPRDLQNSNIRLDVNEASIVVHLPLPSGRIADVAYDRQAPHRLQAVHVRHATTGRTDDVTADLLARTKRPHLRRIYTLLVHPSRNMTSLFGSKQRPCGPAQDPRPLVGPLQHRTETLLKNYGGDQRDVEQRATGTPGV